MTAEELARAIFAAKFPFLPWEATDPGVRVLKIANARRMLAADDLLAALVAKLNANDDEADHAANVLARAAIAKAEG